MSQPDFHLTRNVSKLYGNAVRDNVSIAVSPTGKVFVREGDEIFVAGTRFQLDLYTTGTIDDRKAFCKLAKIPYFKMKAEYDKYAKALKDQDKKSELASFRRKAQSLGFKLVPST